MASEPDRDRHEHGTKHKIPRFHGFVAKDSEHGTRMRPAARVETHQDIPAELRIPYKSSVYHNEGFFDAFYRNQPKDRSPGSRKKFGEASKFQTLIWSLLKNGTVRAKMYEILLAVGLKEFHKVNFERILSAPGTSKC